MGTELLIGIFFLIYTVNNALYLELIESVFDVKSKIGKKIIFSILTGTLGASMLVMFGSMSALGYSIMLAVYVIAVMAFYPKQTIMTRMVCVLQFNLHIMVARAVISSVVSVMRGITIYEISADIDAFWVILIYTALLCAIFTAGLLKLIPKQQLRIMGKKINEMILYLAILIAANIYMIANGNIYIHEIEYAWLPVHQIIASTMWLLAAYIGVFMLVGFDMMRERKKETEKDTIYRQVLESRSLAVLEINCTQDKIIRATRGGKTEALLDESYTDYIKRILKKAVLPEDYDTVFEHQSPLNIIKQFEVGNIMLTHTCKSVMSDDSLRWVRSTISSTKNEKTGDIIAVLTIIDDIHDAKVTELKLKRKAETDPLVGAYNKKTTEILIRNHLELNQFGVLFMIDLDNFKSINDNFGHAYGDEVLKEVYGKLTHHFRTGDIIGRIGGDEFIVFLKGIIPIEDILKKATEVCKSIHVTYTQNGVSVEISSSVGISLCPLHANTFEDLYHMADMAMYTCKKESKNGYAIYNQSCVNQSKK